DGGEERESEGDTRNKVCCKSLLILTFRDIPNFIKPLSPCPHILFGELSTSIFSLSLSLSPSLSLSLSLSPPRPSPPPLLPLPFSVSLSLSLSPPLSLPLYLCPSLSPSL